MEADGNNCTPAGEFTLMAHGRAQSCLLAVQASSSVGIGGFSRDADLSLQDDSGSQLAADGGTCVLMERCVKFQTSGRENKSPLVF